jgi:hypothetical protein
LLILYLATLLNPLVLIDLPKSFGFPLYIKSIHLQTKTNYFSNLNACFSFSWLFLLLWLLVWCWVEMQEFASCPVPDHVGKMFRFFFFCHWVWH